MQKVFLKFNSVIIGVTGAVWGAIQHLAVAGHSSSTESGSRLRQLCIN